MIRHSRVCLPLCFFTLIAARLAVAAPHFPGDRPLDIEHIRLDVYVELENEFVRASASIAGTARRDLTSVELNAVGFQDIGVEVRYGDLEAEKPRFAYDDKILNVPFNHELKRGDRVEIVVNYTLNEPKDGLHFFAPSEDEPDAPHEMWSQGQAISNRYWVPCLDHPNEMQTTEVSCTVERPYIAISNGKLIRVTENEDDTRTYHWKMSQPHVSYLIALAVGDYAPKTETWRGIPVSYYVRKKFEPWIDNSFGNTTRMLDFFSDRIGVKYAWEKYAQICCYNFGGGMENTTCTFLGEGTLHDDRANLDMSSDGLVSHELGHQWFGDLLTCKEWSHLWLNEGFASYCEALWDEESNGEDAFALNMMDKSDNARRGGADKPVVYPDYKNPGEQFDSRAYSKGAWVLHMIRRRLGDELFWKAIHEYVTRFRHKTVETDDLQHVIEEVSGESFGRFFYDWTRRPGNPVVFVSYEWQPDDMLAKVVIKQTQDSDAFYFPLKLEFRFADGNSRVITQHVTEKKETIYVPLRARPVAFRVDPDQAVLMELTEEKPLELWIAQLTDANAALRVAAVRHVAKEGSGTSIDHLATRLLDEPFWGVQEEIAKSLGEDQSEVAQHALLNGLTIKSARALAAVVEALGEYDDEDEVTAALATLVKKGNESYAVEAAAIKSYSAVCRQNDPEAVELFRFCLSRDSHREQVREAAFEALARHGGESEIATILEWSDVGRPIEVRSAAIRALGEIANDDDVASASVEQVLGVLRNVLSGPDQRLARAAISAAEDLGEKARSLKEEIQVLADKEHSRVRWAAKRALEKIDPRDDKSKTLDELKDRVKELEQENEGLRDELKQTNAAKKREVAVNKPEAGATSH